MWACLQSVDVELPCEEFRGVTVFNEGSSVSGMYARAYMFTYRDYDVQYGSMNSHASCDLIQAAAPFPDLHWTN